MLHLISDKLVELVQKHADLIIKRWTNAILSDPTTSSFSEKNMDYIVRKAKQTLQSLGTWVSYDSSKEDVGRLYAEQGKEFFKMGIPLCEVHRAIVVLRRTLWVFVVNESAFDSAFQLHQMRELNERVILFFDRAEYYAFRGYTEAMNDKMMELYNLTKDDLEDVFFGKSFYNRG